MARTPSAAQVLGHVVLVTGKEEYLSARTVASVRDAVRAHDAEAEIAESTASDLTLASLGEMSAQKLAQTRPGALGALLFYSCIPITGEWAFGPWPDGVPVQIHGMDADPIFVGEGDVDAAREIVATVDDAELFLYPGDQHYFADSSLSSYDAEATALLTRRVLDFLGRIHAESA
jgi:hypothetical protein